MAVPFRSLACVKVTHQPGQSGLLPRFPERNVMDRWLEKRVEEFRAGRHAGKIKKVEIRLEIARLRKLMDWEAEHGRMQGIQEAIHLLSPLLRDGAVGGR